MSKNRHFRRATTTQQLRELMPLVIRAAYRQWHLLGGTVPLEALLAIGARQLGEAIDRSTPLVLDFVTPLAGRSGAREVAAA